MNAHTLPVVPVRVTEIIEEYQAKADAAEDAIAASRAAQDALGVAAARNALPRLLDAYEAQAAEIERLRHVVNAADKGSPIYKAIERALDEHSAWIARPSPDVTRAIALAAGVAWMAAEPIDQNLEEIDAALAEERARCAEQEAEIERLRGALDAVVCRVRDERLAPTTGE